MISLNVKAQSDSNKSVIRYANTIIALTNSYYQDLRAYELKLGHLETARDAHELSDKPIELLYECRTLGKSPVRLYQNALNPPETLNADNFYVENIKAYKTGLDDLDLNCAKINDLITTDRFATNQYKEIDSLILGATQTVSDLVNTHQQLVDRMMQRAEKAEAEEMEDNPLASLTTPMKNDLKLAKSLLDKLLNYDQDILPSIKMESLRLRGGVAKSASTVKMKKKEITKAQKAQFEQFYEALENDYVLLANEIVANLEAQRDKNQVYNNLSEDTEKLLEQYNQLVERFNLFGLINVDR